MLLLVLFRNNQKAIYVLGGMEPCNIINNYTVKETPLLHPNLKWSFDDENG